MLTRHDRGEAGEVDERTEQSGVDVSLVEAARRGSAEAFTLLVVRYQAGVLSYLIHLVGERELAADLAQETFLSAYLALYQLDDERSFAAWLYRIAHNKAISHLRRRRVRAVLSLEHVTERLTLRLGRRTEQPEDVIGRELIESILAALPIGEREALLLHSLGGFTAAEVADILDISPAAAGRRISRGKERFRQHYGALNRRDDGGVAHIGETHDDA